ncbi:MAG: Hpt domain-containing protein, partial [Thalassovita sp.]|nr:Hpt domain-containing protein [Thalassovita sp.]
ALTAHVLPENVSEFMQDGMQDVLPKPLMRQDLERIIRAHTQAKCGTPETKGAVSATTVPARKIVNAETNAALRESVGEGYGALRAQLDEELNALVDWLQVECDDLTEIADRCHKFASSAALFGAEMLHQILIDIEIAGKAGNNAIISVRREMLPGLLKDTLEALDRLDSTIG